MSLKDRLKVKLNPAFYWRAAMWAALAAFVLLAAMLWLNAASETEDALASGRRIIIRLADGSFEKAAPELPPAPEETPQESPAAPEESPPAPVESPAPPADSPELPAESPQESPQPQAAAPSEAAPINTARVPLNPVKDSMLEKLSMGTLPIMSPEGNKPWQYYAKPYTLKGNHPMVAVVVTGLGLNSEVTSAAIRLPENMSLSFSPYARELPTWTGSARAAGHEILLDLPLEPTNYPASDPGPYGLLVGKSPEENASRMQWLMGRAQGYIGFTMPNNDAYSLNDGQFKATAEQLSARGLMLFMPHEPVRSETKQIMDSSKLAHTMADVVLDEEFSSETIAARLTALEKLAGKRGYAVGYARGIPLTLKELGEWAANLEERGFTLVPLTYITQRKFK